MIRHLFRRRRIERAQSRREAAQEHLSTARRRGDTRAIHAAQGAVRRATHDLMRLELGR